MAQPYAPPGTHPASQPDEVGEAGEAGSAVSHFAWLAAAGCESFIYHNLEGVPEPSEVGAAKAAVAAGVAAADESADPFTEVTLFKQAEPLIPRTASADAALASWRARNAAAKFFLYYENGKSAVRVDTDGGWVPVSVHSCLPRRADGQWDPDRLLARCWSNDPRNQSVRLEPAQRSRVLHYPVWNALALWQKYRLHGDFGDELASGATAKGGMEWGVCFHTQARDVLLAHRGDADGGLSALSHLFSEAACLPSESDAIRQIGCGVLVRLPGVVDTLPHVRARAEAEARARTAERTREQARALGRVGAGPPPRQLQPPPPPQQQQQQPPPPPPRQPPPPMRRAPQLEWTAGLQTRGRFSYQLSESSVERTEWRGPRRYRSRLSGKQLEALRLMETT